MKGSTRIASALASITASAGVFLGSAAAFATPAPARLIAQTTVPTQQPASPGQARFQTGLETYGFEASSNLDGAASEANVAPACIAGCQPWLTLNQRL